MSARVWLVGAILLLFAKSLPAQSDLSRPTSTALNEAWLLRGQIDTVRKAASPKDTLEQHTAETTLEKPKQTVQRDTLAQQAQSDTLAKKDSLSSRLRPELVALGAALLPGFGQIYNQAYWKLPILYGLLGWFGYNFFTQHQLYLEFRDRYNSDLEQRPIPPSAEANRRFREFYREQRDEFGVYILLVYLASIVDAYVDAHLYGFDISDDLSQRVPVAMPTVPIFTIKLRF